MSRVYITASMQHTNFGIALPTLSVETTDHLGGGYHIKGLHPSSIAKLSGKLPEVKKGERFDLKFNVNAKRCSLALVVATTKHLPHLEWSSESGMGKLPMGVGALASTFLLGNKQSSKTEQRSPSKASNGQAHSRDSRDSKSNRSRHSSSRESHSQSSRSRQSSSRDSRSTRSSPHSSRSSHSTRPQRNLDYYPDYRYKGDDSGYDSDEKYDKYYKRDSRQSQSRSRR